VRNEYRHLKKQKSFPVRKLFADIHWQRLP